MKTIEQDIRERLAAQHLSPANVDAVMLNIKADPLMRAVKGRWEWIATDCATFTESAWKAAWSSAADWLLAQCTAPLTTERPQIIVIDAVFYGKAAQKIFTYHDGGIFWDIAAAFRAFGPASQFILCDAFAPNPEMPNGFKPKPMPEWGPDRIAQWDENEEGG